MADPPHAQRRHLDATGSREVVYCHQCENEWYRNEFGLVCPRCDGEATEIISADNDPRPPEIPAPPSIDELQGLRAHHPWLDHDSDPEEDDLSEFIRDNPQGHTTIISRTFRGSPRQLFASGSSQRPVNRDDPASQTIRDFEGMLSGLLGPNIQQVRPGRPGPEDLRRDRPSPLIVFPPAPSGLGGPPVPDGSNSQPRVFGGRLTFQVGRATPRTVNIGQDQESEDLNTYAAPSQGPPTVLILVLRGQPNEISRILRDLMLVMQPAGANADANAQHPLGGLHGLLRGLLNPAMAVSGDAVYSQEALDRIISTLMEQHPTSNAPGPAPAEAIAALPKKKIDEKMLGSEGKAECSVCMDDVFMDEEVLVLPCNHWFHEQCVKAWLSEHNTCPICRTGVGRDGSAVPAGSNAPSETENQDSHIQSDPFEVLNGPPPEYRHRATFLRRRTSNNEARLASIRNTAGLNNELEGGIAEAQEPRPNPGSRRERSPSPPPNMPGAFSSSSQRNSIFRRQESDTDAGSTGRREREREMERERERERDRERDSEIRSRNSDRLSRNSDNSNSSGSMGGGLGSWFRRFSGGGHGRRSD